MQRTIFLVAVLCAAGLAHAADPPDTAALYSHVLPVQVSGKQAVVQLRLPRDVYLHARSAGLDDLRVFDANGAAQPFAVLRNAPPPRLRTAERAVAVFPVFAPAGGSRRDDFEVRTSDDGTVVSVRTHAGAARADGDVLAGLVLDLGRPSADTAVSGLALTPPPDLRNYSARLAVEVSDDLQNWDTLGDTTVSWLVNARGESVKNDRIAFPPRSFRYARLRWLEGRPVEFTAITAQVGVLQAQALQRDTVVLAAQRASTGNDLLYAAPVAVPADSVALLPHGQNVVLPAAIGRYAALPDKVPGQAPAPDFRQLTSATFYRLVQNGQTRASGDVAIPETHLAQWVVRPQGPLAGLKLPDLRLGWQPATLVFIAGGTPPHVLAFGRTGAASVRVPLGQVAPGFDEGELAGLEVATTGKLVEQQASMSADGASAKPAAAQSRVFWLWGLLLCGVALLGWMAWRLVTQLKSEGAGPTPK